MWCAMRLSIDECCARSRYQGQSHVITSHRYCGMKSLAPVLDTCFWHNTPQLNTWVTIIYAMRPDCNIKRKTKKVSSVYYFKFCPLRFGLIIIKYNFHWNYGNSVWFHRRCFLCVYLCVRACVRARVCACVRVCVLVSKLLNTPVKNRTFVASLANIVHD